jgi:hypothetical protein
MSDLLYLPVSMGEAIDKLSILDIKYDKIKDNRKNDVKKEFDILYEKLEDILEKYKIFYNLMKQINLDIWDMMDILRESKELDNNYLIKCKECVDANDIRFRIKNKINFVSNSLLKEQKSYTITRVIFDIKNINFNIQNIIKSIKYYSILYDEIIILINDNENYNEIINIFNYDPTIKIITSLNEDLINIKSYKFNNQNLNEIYEILNITHDILDKYFIYL